MSNQKAFQGIRMNSRQQKPRTRGITEIRGPYYSVMGKNYLQDILETMGDYVDSLKFAGGAFTLYPEDKLRELIDLAHDYDVKVSTGGFMETVVTQGPEAIDHYISECKRVGFDIIEISTGFITMPTDDIVRLVEKVQNAGLLAKPEIGVQFGAGGTNTVEQNEAEGITDPAQAIEVGKRCLDAGAYMLMIESEGITESVHTWRTEVATQFARELGTEKVMFEAADPDVFEWYIKNYGPEINVFVDHSQIVQLETLRRGTWGTKDLWGRVVTLGE
ncbi:Phosphosulfolactate synthase, CoM biosynthesis protein A [Virgibacillus subterraneus]|uniref:Phosphosulfolactate synthase, CoM biosynthesis protein A n=1 Tax=Virgibacillus subterraneus TaxID=621109 RepID=A0A1H9B4V9_9BACI|nr:phosphosulfolactate synthase [Virgibacillus subterraneus]SEP84080.1 Phosphosulfolactate synthase, CoM biosynthesis protein A [Virgibacillus subterraneus]